MGTSHLRSALLCGVAMAFGWADLASAQAAAPPGPAAAEVPAYTVGEVVVTAQRRRENLQDVPITVTAVSAEALASAGVTNTADLVNLVPGLTVPTSAGYALPHLRGIGITAIGAGIENSVALYVDGVYRGVSSSNAVALNNIAQLEVEKGPQGTLFGRNATGGLIQVTTLDPKPGFSGKADVGYASFGTSSADLYMTGGGDMVAGDLAVMISHQQEGWGVNVATGKDVNRQDLNLSVRSKWLITPAEGAKITAIVDYAQTRFSSSALRNYQNVPNAFYPAGFANLSTYDVNVDSQPLRRMKDGGGSLQIDQDLGFAHLVDTVAYRQDTYHYNIDFDLGPNPYSTNVANQSDKQFTEELQLLSNTASSFTWTTGLYYYFARNAFDPQDIYFSGPAVNAARPVTHVNNQSRETTNSIAVYGQATQALTADTKLTVGLRYTYEDRDLIGLQTGYLNGVVPIILANVDTGVTTKTPTWRIALTHDFSDTVHGYVSYNRGFKSGGYNVTAPAVPAYQPEKLDAYEVGLKTQLFDRRLTLNASVFYYEYQNIQVSRFVNGSPQVYNGGAAVLYGLDVDFAAHLSERLTVSGGLELEHDRFTNFPNADFFLGCAGGYPGICSLSANGNRLPQTPDVSGTINVDYRVPVGEGELAFNVNEAANSGYFFAPNNEYKQSAYGLLNASLRWTRGRYSVNLWGKNLTDVIYPISVNQAPTAVAAAYAAPRTFGLTVGTTF